MSVYAVICEYNPFHNGHKYLIDKIKNKDDCVIAVMSGNFTQRGDVAVCDKFSRAEVAAKNGADLVIELPTVYACAPAETFARGAVEIIDSLGVVDKLCFGAEDDDITMLKEVANAFNNEAFNTELRRNMDSGDYYPKAVQKAIGKIFSPDLSDIVERPNNILAVEYIKALNGTNIEPISVKRIGAAHDSREITEIITSSSNIREMIKKGEDYSRFVPDYKINNTADIKNLELIMLYKLRTMSREDLSNLPDVSEGLENRIFEAVKTSKSLDELFEKVKTKRYTMARIRRIIISALLGITTDLPLTHAPYTRVLAFNEKGEKLMSKIKANGSLPLITNVAKGYTSLDVNAKRIFDIDITASDIWSLAAEKTEVCKSDFTYGVIKT